VSAFLARRPGILALVDPSRGTPRDAALLAVAAATAGAAGLLIGSSFDGGAETQAVARAARQAAPALPIGLFPGSASQLTDAVDAILLLCLVSGRNPQYLIEEHVRAVPFLRRHRVPTISTAYILVDGGRVTSVESVSQTRPLPADKPELAAAHAAAGCLIGMRAVYLEAGSGAARPVPPAVVRACREVVAADVPLLVGGGIREPGQAAEARAAGADFVVVGSALEAAGDGRAALLGAFAGAVRP
jgi:putative glycerol-1-phosphate prenyltransferase